MRLLRGRIRRLRRMAVQSEPVEAKGPLKMGKSISAFLRSFMVITYCSVLTPLLHVNMCCRAVDVASDLPGVFMFLTGDFAGMLIRAALCL